ncbi:MAG: hypothetical protein WKF31_03515 [Thermoleophilaceae bacterium]
MRVLLLSWEYPPLIEGGLARHVRKLAEGLAAPWRRDPRAHPWDGGVSSGGGDRRCLGPPGA